MEETFEEKARRLVFEHAGPQDTRIDFSHVRIVWFTKTLKNWKAMVAILVPDGHFYEVTYNGDKEETYLDCYEKRTTTVVKN